MFDGADGSQMAFWTCCEAAVSAAQIPRGVLHGGEVLTGTRTIHAFGGHRADRTGVRLDPAAGDVILSRRSDSWENFFKLTEQTGVPDDFKSDRQNGAPQKRDAIRPRLRRKWRAALAFWAKPPKSRLERKDLACVSWANRPKLCRCHRLLWSSAAARRRTLAVPGRRVSAQNVGFGSGPTLRADPDRTRNRRPADGEPRYDGRRSRPRVGSRSGHQPSSV